MPEVEALYAACSSEDKNRIQQTLKGINRTHASEKYKGDMATLQARVENLNRELPALERDFEVEVEQRLGNAQSCPVQTDTGNSFIPVFCSICRLVLSANNHGRPKVAKKKAN